MRPSAHRGFLTTAFALLLAAPSLPAQQAEEQPPTQVYVAHYKISSQRCE